ncbi:hypothetical protein [Streptomyces varsoviensis]|uniref:hypothetical protein n=1 Tax=Streptomyces varsoviensis TaxID=67373 RepID=UPI0004CA5011|nr:hypothetical protein [Streptomyces varsoviensis]
MSVTAVLHSEWVKIRSLRPVLGALLGVPLVTTGITLLVCANADGNPAGGVEFDPVFTSFLGVTFGQMAALCFGVLAVSAEFRGAALGSSLAAVPRRGLFYSCKLAVAAVLALAVGLVTALASFLGGQAALGDCGVGLGTPGALRAVLGCGAYLALLAVLAAGCAALLRGPVLSLGVLIPVVCLVSPVLGEMSGAVGRYLPDRAGQEALHTTASDGLGPWPGLAVLAGWAALAALAGWRALERRDA